MRNTLVSLIGCLIIVAACQPTITSAATHITTITDRSEMLSLFEPEYAMGLYVAGCKRLGFSGSCSPVRQIQFSANAAAPRVDTSNSGNAYEAHIEQTDRDAGPGSPAMSVCATGIVTREHDHAVTACNLSYDHAMRGKDFESAMYYMALGCEKYRNVGLCRRGARLPMELGTAGIEVPDSFRADLKRLAEKVCFSGQSIEVVSGVDVAARECAYFARIFNLPSDPEYAIALAPTAMRFYETLQDRNFASKLYAAACGRRYAADDCELARELGEKKVSQP